MKKKGMIIGIVIVIAVIIVVGAIIVLVSNNKDNNEDSSKTTNMTGQTDKTTNFIDNNDSYFILIDGKKFFAGDKISDLSTVNYNLKKSEADIEVPANKYMIGAGQITNTKDKTSFYVTPYNPSNSSIKVSEAVIGGVSLSYDNIKYDEKLAEIELYGGIKLTSTMEEVKKVFGEPSSITTGTTSTTFKYRSEETYRDYTFNFDKEGKLHGIAWQNLVFNKK